MNPARLINIATQLALSSNDTPERQDDLRRNAKFQGLRHEGWEKVTKEILKLTGGTEK